MPTLTVYPTGPQNQALATLRYRAAAEVLGWQIVLGKEGVDTVFPERVQQADVVLIPRDFPRFFEPFRQVLAEARRAGKPVVYDLDDLLLAIPAEHPYLNDYEDALGGILYAIIEADQVIVSTPLLREVLLPLQPRIAVWPTLLPDALWKLQTPRLSEPAAPLTIGYMGGLSHGPDLEMITAVLQHLLNMRGDQVEIHFWGCSPPAALAEQPQVRQVNPGVADYAEFAQVFSTTAFADIWLAPLKANLFNRCKSAIKFWEYSALGGAGIYSRLEPYEMVVQDGENGLLAGSYEEWLAAITQLADNPDLRLRLAENAQQTLRQQGLLSTGLDLWQEVYTAVSPYPHHNQPQAKPLLMQMLQRYSENVQQRSDQRHQETLKLVTIQQEVLARNQALQTRSDQLEAILQSPRWRAWQRFKKIARLDFSPLPPHEPFD
jgi:hypothetical protein